MDNRVIEVNPSIVDSHCPNSDESLKLVIRSFELSGVERFDKIVGG